MKYDSIFLICIASIVGTSAFGQFFLKWNDLQNLANAHFFTIIVLCAIVVLAWFKKD